jgi:glycosyltransferase involved in cell wall biosynthesis
MVLVVGDPDGMPDEGMKQISRHLLTGLSQAGFDARIVDVRSAVHLLLLGQSRDEVVAVALASGPTFWTLLLAFLCSWRRPRLRVGIVFSQPRFGLMGRGLLAFVRRRSLRVFAAGGRDVQRARRWGIEVTETPASGVDLEQFVPTSRQERIVIRRKLALPEDTIVVLHVGHLKAERNVMVLADLARVPGFTSVMIASTTTKVDAGVAQELTAAGVQIRTEYIANLQEYYQASDAYLFPTVAAAEAVQLPLSVIEAMACGVPVVSTRFGVLPELFPESASFRYVSTDAAAAEWIALIEAVAHERWSNHNRESVECLSWSVVQAPLLAWLCAAESEA